MHLIGSKRSPKLARMLRIDWREASWPMAKDDKYGERSLPISNLLQLDDRKHRPAIVYIRGLIDFEDRMAYEEKIFGSEEIVLATRFFRCFEIDAREIRDERIQKQYLKKVPVLLFLDARGEEVARLAGKKSASAFRSAMNRVFAAHYKASMSKVLAAMEDLVDEVQKAEDRVADASVLLDGVKARMDDREGEAADKKVDKRQQAYDEAVAEFEKLLDRLVELSNPPLLREDLAKDG
ncbi:MAG: hypothetical protein H6807_12665 [Planctomycetes bacterium]|nr:hypothetical protein [Planctomycetota bacterium]